MPLPESTLDYINQKALEEAQEKFIRLECLKTAATTQGSSASSVTRYAQKYYDWVMNK